jgi:hypothetical protein
LLKECYIGSSSLSLGSVFLSVDKNGSSSPSLFPVSFQNNPLQALSLVLPGGCVGGDMLSLLKEGTIIGTYAITPQDISRSSAIVTASIPLSDEMYSFGVIWTNAQGMKTFMGAISLRIDSPAPMPAPIYPASAQNNSSPAVWITLPSNLLHIPATLYLLNKGVTIESTSLTGVAGSIENTIGSARSLPDGSYVLNSVWESITQREDGQQNTVFLGSMSLVIGSNAPSPVTLNMTSETTSPIPAVSLSLSTFSYQPGEQLTFLANASPLALYILTQNDLNAGYVIFTSSKAIPNGPSILSVVATTPSQGVVGSVSVILSGSPSLAAIGPTINTGSVTLYFNEGISGLSLTGINAKLVYGTLNYPLSNTPTSPSTSNLALLNPVGSLPSGSIIGSLSALNLPLNSATAFLVFTRDAIMDRLPSDSDIFVSLEAGAIADVINTPPVHSLATTQYSAVHLTGG